MRKLILTVLLATCCPMVFADDGTRLTGMEQEFFELLNVERAKFRLPPLEIDPVLTSGAQKWSVRMRSRGFYHGASNENIARGAHTASAALRMWMNSPKHRVALLSRHYTVMGIGQDHGYWTFRGGTKTVTRTRTVTREVVKSAPMTRMVCTPAGCSPVRDTPVPRSCMPVQCK